MIRISDWGSGAYVVDPPYIITREQWLYAQEFRLTEGRDSEGFILWFLTGPETDMATYSWRAVRAALELIGVDHRFVRRDHYREPGSFVTGCE